jgi:hypothetical protein
MADQATVGTPTQWDAARDYCKSKSLQARIDPDNYYHQNPFEIMKKITALHPPLIRGIPDSVGYYWFMDMNVDNPNPTLVFVNDGKVWAFGGARIPTPKADKMWFQGGIIPPFSTEDFKRDGRYFVTTLPGEPG